jgi:pilus assembly protein CpaF
LSGSSKNPKTMYSQLLGAPEEEGFPALRNEEANLQELREKLFHRFWTSDSDALKDQDQVRRQLREIVSSEGLPLSLSLIDTLMRDIFSYGPVTELMADPLVTDIWIDDCRTITYEKDGRTAQWKETFYSEEHLRRFVMRLAAATGRKIDESRPVEDFRLPDGSRVVAILSGPSVRGTSLAIRRFARLFTLEELVERSLFPRDLLRLFELLAKARINIFTAGGMGTGKNTFLYALLLHVGEGERLAFVEDPAESRVGLPDAARPHLPTPRAVVYEPRRAGVEGEGEVSIDVLFEKVLRTKPTRVICSECRNEVTTYWTLQAMNIGHPGSMSSIHAEGPREVPQRLSDMLAAYRGGAYSTLASRTGKVAAAELIIYLGQINGHRRMLDIAEVRREGSDQDSLPSVVPLYTFDVRGFQEDGAPIGELKPTGNAPGFLKKRKISLYLSPDEITELRGYF